MNIYKIRTAVNSLELKKRIISTRIDPADPTAKATVTETEEIGWFVNFKNSHESLYVGRIKPDDLEPGTEVDIMIMPVIRKE